MNLRSFWRTRVDGPWGDTARHLSRADLEKGMKVLAPPQDDGTLECLVIRGPRGKRELPEAVDLSPESGVAGDAWARDMPDRPDSQVAVMRVDVARLIANGQSLGLFGDNMLVDLDLSAGNLPIGSLLQVGQAQLQVTPEPHDGCRKFKQRFGQDALALTADQRFKDHRLRGVYLCVRSGGTVMVGDPVRILHRGPRD